MVSTVPLNNMAGGGGSGNAWRALYGSATSLQPKKAKEDHVQSHTARVRRRSLPASRPGCSDRSLVGLVAAGTKRPSEDLGELSRGAASLVGFRTGGARKAATTPRAAVIGAAGLASPNRSL